MSGPRPARGEKKISLPFSLAAGSVSAVVSSVLVTPLDVVKTRLQAGAGKECCPPVGEGACGSWSMAVWQCGCVAVWLCGCVVQCGWWIVAVWIVAVCAWLRLRRRVVGARDAARRCQDAAPGRGWEGVLPACWRGCVGLMVNGCVAVWLCGCVAVWQCG
jgi:hypothetical protein